MPLTSGYSVALPIFSASPVPGDAYKIEGEVCGSAFALGGHFMLSTCHVASEASAGSRQAVVGLTGPDGYLKSARVVEYEQLQADLAILQVEFVFSGSEK